MSCAVMPSHLAILSTSDIVNGYAPDIRPATVGREIPRTRPRSLRCLKCSIVHAQQRYSGIVSVGADTVAFQTRPRGGSDSRGVLVWDTSGVLRQARARYAFCRHGLEQ